MIKKLLLLVIFLASFLLLSSFTTKPALACTLDSQCSSGHCNKNTGTCRHRACQSNGSCIWANSDGTDGCQSYLNCPQPKATPTRGPTPTPGGIHYTCPDTSGQFCALGTDGCGTGTPGGSGTCAPGNICCIGSGDGGGGNPAPPPRTFQNEPLCHAVGQPCSNTSGSSGSTNLNSIGCCYPLICWTGYTGGGSMLETTCQRPQTPSTNQSCNGVFCETSIGRLATNSPGGLVQSIFAVLLSISGGIAVILIIISGYRLMTSRGNPEQVQMAKEQLTAAIVGLLFIIFSLVVLQTIGVNILNLPTFKSN